MAPASECRVVHGRQRPRRECDDLGVQICGRREAVAGQASRQRKHASPSEEARQGSAHTWHPGEVPLLLDRSRRRSRQRHNRGSYRRMRNALVLRELEQEVGARACAIDARLAVQAHLDPPHATGRDGDRGFVAPRARRALAADGLGRPAAVRGDQANEDGQPTERPVRPGVRHPRPPRHIDLRAGLSVRWDRRLE